MLEQAPTRQLELDIARLEKEIESFSQEKLCYEAQILRVRLGLRMCCNGFLIASLSKIPSVSFFHKALGCRVVFCPSC